ncbi:hypothetical protein Tco_1074276 [Tanacetum coccineum]
MSDKSKNANPVSLPLAGYFKLIKKDCPTTEKEKAGMASVPYSFMVGSSMYAMVCTRPDIAHAVGLTALEGFTDAVMAGDLDNRMSTLGYLFKFARGAISWQSKLQKCVTLSKIEAKYVADVEACKEIVWLKRFLRE